MTKTLTPRQIENLQHRVINDSMAGMAGIGIQTMRNMGIEPTQQLYKLNDELVNIEMKARREMKKILIDFFDTLK